MTSCPAHVLIVDDDPLLRVIAESFFRSKGVERVDVATDGRNAIEVLDQSDEPPSLILADLNMPNLDGLQFLRLLKERDFQGEIVILSGEHHSILTLAEKLAQTHKLNIIAALAKPLKPKELESVLRKARSDQAVHYLDPRITFNHAELQKAIVSGEIIPYYQPQIASDTGHVVGVEALARWNHPQYSIISPDDFIPFAEKTGLIKPLTNRMIRMVIRDARRLVRLRMNLKISVNLSVDVLTDLELPDQVAFLLDEVDLSPANFVFEITESGIVKQDAIPIEVLARLRMHGFGLSIDDFGTAYSNLEHLMHFPFTELKIDRMFVSKALEDERSMIGVETSISLARRLNLKIVAEGVETEDDWCYLAKLGVDELQGFHFARPMPLEDLLAFLVDKGGFAVPPDLKQALLFRQG